MRRVLKILLMFLFVMFSLVGCDSSTDETDVKFTNDILVDQTYVVVNDTSTITYSFTDTTVSIVDGLVTIYTDYEINGNGELVIGGTAIYSLIKKEDSGNLIVENNGVQSTWVPINSYDRFTYEMLVNKIYDIIGSTTKTYSFAADNTVTINENGITDILSYEINDFGEVVIGGFDIHHLISQEDNGNLLVENNGEEFTWRPRI